MARFFSLRSSTRARTREVQDGAVLAAEPDGDSCDSYAPGHQVHYIHQGQALRSPSLHARNVIVEGHRVIVVLDDGNQLDYHHHDPDRLSSVLGLFPASRMVYPKFHALRVGPYWFNCAPGEFEPCRPHVEVGRP
jgi:hypothetical protein